MSEKMISKNETKNLIEKELKLGFMSNEELAEWSNKTVESLKRNRRRWCEDKLSQYATFEIVKKGVNILSIIDPIYTPNGKKEVADKWKDNWGYNGFRVDTNIDCWNKLKPQMKAQLSDNTGKSYISRCKCAEYGVPYKKKKRSGHLGSCHYTFCKIIDGIPVPFTEDECRIKKQLEDKHLQNNKEQRYKMQALLADLKRGEISQADYQDAITDVLENDYSWIDFQMELEKAIGCITDFRVELVDEINFEEFNARSTGERFDF